MVVLADYGVRTIRLRPRVCSSIGTGLLSAISDFCLGFCVGIRIMEHGIHGGYVKDWLRTWYLSCMNFGPALKIKDAQL